MNWDDIYLVTRNLEPVASDTIDKLEKHFGITMPTGYREYMSRFGKGIYCGDIYIPPPQQIKIGWFEVWRDKTLFPLKEDLVSKEFIIESIVVGSSGNGDNIIFHPEAPDKFYVLQHGNDEIYFAGTTLEETLDWVRTSNIILEPCEVPYFETSKNRRKIDLRLPLSSLDSLQKLREVALDLNGYKHGWIWDDANGNYEFEFSITLLLDGNWGIIEALVWALDYKYEDDIVFSVTYDTDKEDSQELKEIVDALKEFGFTPEEAFTVPNMDTMTLQLFDTNRDTFQELHDFLISLDCHQYKTIYSKDEHGRETLRMGIQDIGGMIFLNVYTDKDPQISIHLDTNKKIHPTYEKLIQALYTYGFREKQSF